MKCYLAVSIFKKLVTLIVVAINIDSFGMRHEIGVSGFCVKQVLSLIYCVLKNQYLVVETQFFILSILKYG
jgi:hypothetical protein